MHLLEMKQLWVEQMELAGVPLSSGLEVFSDLVGRYNQKRRYYHNLNHIAHLLKLWQENKTALQDPLAVFLAIWFHDAVYRPGSLSNEQKSAELVKKLFAHTTMSGCLIDKVQTLVMATRLHYGEDRDSQIFIDFDLAILGEPSSVYRRYVFGVFKESSMPNAIFAPLRRRWLLKMLDRPRLFNAMPGQEIYEVGARENLKMELHRGGSYGDYGIPENARA